MNIPEYQARWRNANLSERASAQSNFLDICELVGHKKPAELDPAGTFFTFEKGLGKSGGGGGFADVWYRGHFAWEYKRDGSDLDKAFKQLKLYAEALDNPPLLIVSDNQRIIIHTAWTNTAAVTHEITLADLDNPEKFRLLRDAFFEPERLKPCTKREQVTREAAERVGKLALSLQQRQHDPLAVAHFLVQLLFCLFAEDVGLLPRGIFEKTLEGASKRPEGFTERITALLGAMRDGGFYGADDIARFNGGLFATVAPIALTTGELTELAQAAKLDWGNVEPAIFGTLFERSLDPKSRAQLGAHYTGRADIERVVDPVVMMPLRRRWDEVRAEADRLKAEWDAATTPRTRDNRRAAFSALLNGFKAELAAVTVLDPACGSGNFLYVALSRLLDLEKEVIVYGAGNGLPLGYPLVNPAQLAGLEINAYARELAQVVVWIGYLQWKIDNGFPGNDDPILKPLETIRLQDALLDLSDPAHPKEAEWPAADFIIGNPPFLGDKKLRAELGEEYTRSLFVIYKGRVPGGADLCCYFLENARCHIVNGKSKRAGLLATNSVRAGRNRTVLDRIKTTGGLFFAWSDEPWTLDGAAVRISIVGFDNGSESAIFLNGKSVTSINSDLTSGVDVTRAMQLVENRSIAFVGVQPTGAFDISEETARRWLRLPSNPNGRGNFEVVRKYVNGSDITGRDSKRWIVDFGSDMSEQDASLYQIPFEYVRANVFLSRQTRREKGLRDRWWIFERPRPDLRIALSGLDRYLATSMVSTKRYFVWLSSTVLPANLLVVFSRQDDYFLGILSSRPHVIWSDTLGSDLGKGNDPRYNTGRCFETFPLPWPPGQEPWRDERLHAIANAARELDDTRNRWLNPPDADAATLKRRTLTSLYNERPTWLAHLHAALDRAVWSAYGWDDDPAQTSDETILERLLALNQQRAGG